MATTLVKNEEVESTTRYTLADLPEHEHLDLIDLIGRVYNPIRIFEHAYHEFFKALYTENIRPHIKILMDAGDLRIQENWEKHQGSFRVVKRARKMAEALGSVVVFVDDAHVQSPELKRLNKEIGDFKDEVVYRPARKNADDLYRALESLLKTGLSPLSPASPESFWEKYRSLLNDVYTLFNMEDLTLKQHHKLRVRMRSFVYFYKAIAASTGNDQLLKVAQYLDVVVAEMGKTQDRIYVLKHKGKVDEEADRTHLNPVHRKIIGDFLDMNGL